MADAARADEALARGGPSGVLHGLPVAHKDLVDTAGIRTTQGLAVLSRPRARRSDALLVTRIRAAGAVTVGKTNTPEFGAGSQTFNTVFGATRNPYDLTKTCGGSSGGAAVALRQRDGADRRRQRHRRVAAKPGGVLQRRRLPAVAGPRAARIVVLVAAVGGRPDGAHRWPTSRSSSARLPGPIRGARSSLQEDGARFGASLGRDFKGARVAWWRDLGGIPFEPEIVPGRRREPPRLRGHSAASSRRPNRISPDVDDAFATLRYAANHPRYAPLVRERPEWVKDTIKFEVAEAETTDRRRRRPRDWRGRRGCTTRAAQFFERYDYFVLPVTQVAPFDVTTPYPTQIAGTPMTSYIDWMRSCWYVTMMANPAISVPGGFTASGLPVGLQIVGTPPRRLERAAARPRV